MRLLPFTLLVLPVLACSSATSREAARCEPPCTVVVANNGDIALDVMGWEVVGPGHSVRMVLAGAPRAVRASYHAENGQKYGVGCRFDGRIDDELRYSCGARPNDAIVNNTRAQPARTPLTERRPGDPVNPPTGIPDSIR
jgi:hypothetical protein